MTLAILSLFPSLSFGCICFKGVWKVRMKKGSRAEKGKLEVDKRTFSKLAKLRESSTQ